MATPLSLATIATIKASIPALEAHGLAIVTRMYERLFESSELAAFFNKSHHSGAMTQPKALTGAVLAYATWIETPEVLAAAIERIAQKHASLQISAEHYAPVRAALLGAMQDVLGETATPEILAAWGEAYGFLADVLIAQERAIYAATEAAAGGWRGRRAFTIASRRGESADVTTFRLLPVDGGRVLRHKAGQFLAFRLGEAGLVRHYSISSAPNDEFYEITVKRDGEGSRWLHDHALPGTVLEVTPPAGDFTLGRPEGKILMLAAGVGITPLRSMLGEMGADMRARTRLFHAVRSLGDALPLPGLAAQENLVCEDRQGRINIAALARKFDLARTDVYLCGPSSFMREMIAGLKAAGLSADRIHYEVFGPAEAL